MSTWESDNDHRENFWELVAVGVVFTLCVLVGIVIVGVMR